MASWHSITKTVGRRRKGASPRCRQGGGVGVGAAEDVGVAEELPVAGASGQAWAGGRRRDRSAVHQRLTVGVDGRADGGAAAVDPDGGGELAGGDGVVVVAQELGRQAVGAGPTAVADRPLVQVLNAPTAPVARVTLAWRTTPSIWRGVAVVVRQGSRWAL